MKLTLKNSLPVLAIGVLLGSFIVQNVPLNMTGKDDAYAMISNINSLSKYKQHRVSNKSIAGPANNAETDIVNIPSGAGIITYLWLADRPGSGGGFPEFDHSIRIYANGASTPDVDTDLGLFFGYAYGNVMPAGNIHTDHWQARVGGTAHIDRSGGAIKLAIPFSNGIRIAVANPTNTPISALFSQVDYALASENPDLTIPPYTLKVAGNRWIGGRLTASASNVVTLATIPAGNPGIIVGHSMAAGGASDYSYMEREASLYIDGESTASIKSSGTEDWFGGSDYFFTGQTPYSSFGAMGFGVTSDTAYGFSALADFLAMNGGYAFTSSAVLKLNTHPAATSNNTYGSALFYYRSN